MKTQSSLKVCTAAINGRLSNDKQRTNPVDITFSWFDSAAGVSIVYIQTLEICHMNLSFANVQGDFQLQVQLLRDAMIL